MSALGDGIVKPLCYSCRKVPATSYRKSGNYVVWYCDVCAEERRHAIRKARLVARKRGANVHKS